MSLLGNLIWLVFGGAIASLSYILAGFALCLTVVGIPFGIKAIQFGVMVLFPFGKVIDGGGSGTGCLAMAFNIIWLLTVGWSIALTHLLFGIMLAFTLLGIPFAIQHFKLVPVALFPFSYKLGSSSTT